MEQYEALLYFISGALGHKLLSYVFNVGKSIELYNVTIKNCIGAMRIADETKKMSQELKYTLLEGAGMPILELDSVRDQDDNITWLWRIVAMGALLAALPNHATKNLRFKDWDTAMKIIDKEIK